MFVKGILFVWILYYILRNTKHHLCINAKCVLLKAIQFNLLSFENWSNAISVSMYLDKRVIKMKVVTAQEMLRWGTGTCVYISFPCLFFCAHLDTKFWSLHWWTKTTSPNKSLEWEGSEKLALGLVLFIMEWNKILDLEVTPWGGIFCF